MENQLAAFSNCEIWGGIECSFNRVSAVYFDQLLLTGHYDRADDIQMLCSLGIEKIRYPILWERHEPVKDCEIDWRWATQQLDAFREHNVQPIVGLVHHGSGPQFTDLTQETFATGLAAYAGKVARQFPWVEYYTPVNEPLTTARFSGLYGLWYPHKTQALTFLKILLTELKATVLAMQEIRKINAEAKLIQTEDLSKVFSTPSLQYQADFENERRWLTNDFLCGKVTRSHNLWPYLRWVGLTERELLFFHDNPCIPSVAGFNYYPTSERFLDDDLSRYPEYLHGGNGRHRYVDTEAIRIDHGQPYGLKVLLKEAWDRYKIPVAVTEAFLSCTNDEQVRWLNEIWLDAQSLREEGVDVRAVTFWALLGEVGWNNLITNPHDGEYECGAFDVRGGKLTPTMISDFIKTLATDKVYQDAVINEAGWWRRSDRFFHQVSCAL